MSVALTSPERRKTPRVQLESMVLIDIGEENAGTITDVSEGGLCFQAVAPIDQGETVYFRLQPDDRNQGRGRVAWTDETQKRGGLAFTQLSVQMREQICALTELAIPGLATSSSEELRQGADITTDSVQLSLVSAQAVQKGLFRGFTGGLVTGVLVSFLLISAALMCRRQIGESLIVLGEHLASKSASLTQSVHKEGERVSALDLSERYPVTIAKLQTESHQNINERDSTDTSSLRPVHSEGEFPGVAQAQQTKQFGEQEHSNPVAPHEGKTEVRRFTANLSLPPSTGLPGVAMPPLPFSIATLGLTKPSPPQQSTRASMRAETVSYDSNVRNGSQMYFEVGRFKEHSRAREERDKLTRLGYPATVQQKRRLWRTFYDVLVGPYQNSDDAEAVHKSLVVRGFQARPFERGYRHFVLPPHLVLNGVPTPVGECVIRWESYIADVKVRFEQDDHVISTAQGTWVKRDPKYENSAIVYTPDRNGWRSLNELRFAGLTRALVFPN
ncbi:MAG TPA: PilZ domain-containing protein [Terriglobales bacterium]|nr:PilZ domain-containing protein [Terriglobales bacterium]